MSKQTNWAPLIAGQAGIVPLSLGIPGVAKTAFFESLAQATSRRFIPYMLDQSLPEDLKGYPIVEEVEAGGRTSSRVQHASHATASVASRSWRRNSRSSRREAGSTVMKRPPRVAMWRRLSRLASLQSAT
jgi:MoxR-like ATPase